MKRRQPVIFISVGLVCAAIAAVAVHKSLSRASEPGPATSNLQIAVASRDIVFGEALVVEGYGEDANVVFAPGWPENLKLAGAIYEMDRLSQQSLRAGVPFVRNQPILEPQTVPKESFVPPGMVLERITVDQQDVRSGRLRAGMLVDVLRLVDNSPTVFMQNVRLFALGNLDSDSRPVREKDPPPYAFVMIRKSDQLDFLKSRLADKFMLVEAAKPEAPGPIIVDQSVQLEEKRVGAQAVLQLAQDLIKEGQVEKAAGILQEVSIRYPDLSDVCRQAEKVMTQCRQKLADALYERAEKAAKERKDFSAALGILDKLEADFPDFADVLQKAKDLRAATQQSLDKYRAQTRYRALVADVTVALQGGNAPRARELLSELEGLIQKGIEPEADLPVPQDAWQGYQTRLKALEARYDVDRKVFEAHLKQGNVQEARTKLEEMRGRYPLDPVAEELEKMLPAG